MDKDIEKAKTSAFRLLKFRIRSTYEIEQRLRQKKYPQPVIREVLDFLSDLGYLDDSAFATAWINGRMNLKPRSRRLLIRELKQKGISDEIIEQALNKTTRIEDENTAYILAKSKFEKIKGLDSNKIKNRLAGYLQRRGFAPGLIFKIVKGLIKDD